MKTKTDILLALPYRLGVGWVRSLWGLIFLAQALQPGRSPNICLSSLLVFFEALAHNGQCSRAKAKKNICLLPISLPTLFQGPYPKVFIDFIAQ